MGFIEVPGIKNENDFSKCTDRDSTARGSMLTRISYAMMSKITEQHFLLLSLFPQIIIKATGRIQVCYKLATLKFSLRFLDQEVGRPMYTKSKIVCYPAQPKIADKRTAPIPVVSRG